MRVKGDIGTERAVLSGICQYGRDVFFDISDIITPHSFFKKNNQLIFCCLEKALQYSDDVDIPLIISSANELGLESHIDTPDEIEFIDSLFHFPIKKDNVRKLAVKLKKLEIARDLQDQVQKAHENLGEVTGKESIDEILSLAEEPVFDSISHLHGNKEDKTKNIAEDAKEYIEHLIDNPSESVGISTYFDIYDEAIGGGLRRGGVNIIAARPKNGKSSIAKEIGKNVATQSKIPVLYLDTEMKKEDQLHRLLSSMADVPTRKIESGFFGNNQHEKNRVFAAIEQLQSSSFYYRNVSGKPFAQILSIIRRWIMTDVGYDENGNINDALLIYDYFKLMDISDLDKMQEYQAIGFQLSSLIDFCSQNDLAAIAFVQANRDALDKEDTSIVSQSDRILWFASSLSFLRRKREDEIVEDGDENGNAIIKVMETRFGAGLSENDYINLRFDGYKNKIEELKTRNQIIKERRENNFG